MMQLENYLKSLEIFEDGILNAQGPSPCGTRPHLLRFRADYHVQDEACEHQVKPDIARDTHVKVCDNQRARGEHIVHGITSC